MISRGFDLLLLTVIGFLAWKLVRADDHLVDVSQPLTAKVWVAGEMPLEGLALLIVASEELHKLGEGFGSHHGGQDTTPHQLSPFYRDRTAQIIVPCPGTYTVCFGLQDHGPPPRRPRGVMMELAPEAKIPRQVIEVTDNALAEEIQIELPEAHALGLQALLNAD